jgi:hypothetical protein
MRATSSAGSPPGGIRRARARMGRRLSGVGYGARQIGMSASVTGVSTLRGPMEIDFEDDELHGGSFGHFVGTSR